MADQTLKLDLRVVITALTALTTAAALWRMRQRTDLQSVISPKESLDTESRHADKSEANTEKYYDEVWERYDASKGEWCPQVQGDQDESSHYFTVKHRSWPETSGQENYSVVAVRSHAVVNVLRRIMGRHVEEVNEEDVTVDGRDLWLCRDRLRLELQRLEQQLNDTEIHVELDGGETDKQPHDMASVAIEGPAGVVEDVECMTTPMIRLSLEEMKTTTEHLSIMLEILETDLYSGVTSKLERLRQNGKLITYQLLWTQFPYDSIAVAFHEASQEPYAFKVRTWSYQNASDGPVFALGGTAITWTGSKYVRTSVEVEIPKFKGMRNAASLSVWPLSDRQRDELTERGQRYKELAGVRFMDYDGVLIQTHGSGMNKKIIKYRAKGRSVIDVALYRRLVPNNREFSAWDFWDDEDDYIEGSNAWAEYPLGSEGPSDAELYLLPPTLFGFSLEVREWGEMMVTKFSEISFNPTAWDQLVLDPQVKSLIRSLVESNTSLLRARAVESSNPSAGVVEGLLQDVIQGKGTGLVFCGHGRPGVGKTLTAEALSEFCKAPLYSVTAGDLGHNAAALESKLRDLLDIAESWGAILLIDEADVFLERRSLNDIGRNGLVSVFLRMLERHSGVLFLTTNRLKSIDEAFLSRFSIGLKYEDLDKTKRRKIWAANLERAGVGIAGNDEGEPTETVQTNGLVTPGQSTPGTPRLGPAAFSSYMKSQDLDRLASRSGQNGRTIKNTVRTAQALARSRNLPLGMEQLETVLKVGENFLESFKEADEEGMYDAAGEGWKDRQNIYN